MDSGPVVVDISSEDEADSDIVRNPVDISCELINQWVGDKEGGDANNFVDLDKYLNSAESHGPLRPKSGVARYDSDDECVILDNDPDKPVVVDDGKRDKGDGSDDLCIVGHKGQVACRDFPHSRHLCANFPFNSTSHNQHCKLCHCFVCDSPAPCIYWGNGASFTDHCHATDKEERWKVERKSSKKVNTLNIPSQKIPVVKRPVPQAIRDPQPIHIRLPVPAPTPIKPCKASSLRPCSNTSTSTIQVLAQKPHQNPVCYRRQIPSVPSQRSQPVHRVNRDSSALATMQCTQFKRVTTTTSAIYSRTTRPQHTSYSSFQTPRDMPLTPQFLPKTSFGLQQRPVALPRSQSLPVQRSLHAPVTSDLSSKTVNPSPEEDSIKQWQDILAGVAAELGVSDSINKTTTASQPYIPSSQSLDFETPIQCSMNINQGMSIHTDLAPATTSSNPADVADSWLGTSAGHNYHRGGEGGDFELATFQPSKPLVAVNNGAVSGGLCLESLLEAVGPTAPVPGIETVLPEIDPASFLYDIDCPWSSISNV